MATLSFLTDTLSQVIESLANTIESKDFEPTANIMGTLEEALRTTRQRTPEQMDASSMLRSVYEELDNLALSFQMDQQNAAESDIKPLVDMIRRLMSIRDAMMELMSTLTKVDWDNQRRF